MQPSSVIPTATLVQLERYRRRYSLPQKWTPPQSTAAFSQAALLSARRLLPADQVWHTEASEVFARLSSGHVLCLSVDQDARINGRAAREGTLRVAAVTTGMARALFDLAASLWSNRAFLPEMGETALLPSSPALGLPVPRGLEFVAAVSRSHRKEMLDTLAAAPPPGWLITGLSKLTGRRKALFERTVYEGIRFLLLHELGHVCLGHLDVADGASKHNALHEAPASLPVGRDGKHTRVKASVPDGVLRAFEIEADRYASTKLFDRNDPSSAGPAQAEQDMSPTQISLLGATLVPLIFHAQHVFGLSPDQGSTHPPLWFRADDIVRSALSRTPVEEPAFSLHQLAERGRLDAVLHAVARTHPLFGEWLGPITDGSRDDWADQVLMEARHARADFSRHRVRAPVHVVQT